MQAFGLKNCDSCRKAVSLLGCTLTDVRAEGMPVGLLERAASVFGAQLMNTRSTTWRNIPESEREGDMLDLLRAHPTLMKRPLIEHEGRLYLGWGRDVQNSLLGQ